MRAYFGVTVKLITANFSLGGGDLALWQKIEDCER